MSSKVTNSINLYFIRHVLVKDNMGEWDYASRLRVERYSITPKGFERERLIKSHNTEEKTEHPGALASWMLGQNTLQRKIAHAPSECLAETLKARQGR